MTDTQSQPTTTDLTGRLPGAAVPYVVRYGEGLRHNAAGQIVYTLAGTDETAGGFGAMLGELPSDRQPIPLHYHEREHDTWFCLRGKIQVWCNEQSRVLSPGDFAYVKPRDIHAYQSLAPRSSFFGIVAPGGWERFFVEAGEVWGMTALPPEGHPFDFRRMGPAMANNDVHPVSDATYASATPIGPDDQALPNGNSSYFLDAGHGTRRHLLGHLVTSIMTGDQCAEIADFRLVEGPSGTAMPTMSHNTTTTFLFMLAGEVVVTLDGVEHRVHAGDGVNIPAGTRYATRITSGTARWLACSANGNGGRIWDHGMPTSAFCFTGTCDIPTERERLAGASGLDCTIEP
ncbi:quercetin 2,3-dioxygenase family protein [Sphingomonas sp. LB3N6]|uniref:cupin domain-containing protein n=1 Tax=Sphingomonas fucosidasi TaxID=3096164 RepID=UPI002FC730F5